MREKSDKSKLRDGRGILTDKSYEAWKTAREAKSTGTACALYDPIQQRTINLLSQGERKVFWALRYITDNRILEQFPLDAETIREICDEMGVRKYSSILSTDFLAESNSGKVVAISVKPNASVFDLSTKNGNRNFVRNEVEVRYWARQGVDHIVVYSDQIGIDYANNIRDVMSYWEEKWINDAVGMLMHLIARHIIRIPLDKGRIPFKQIASSIPVEEYYEIYRRQIDNSNFQGWRIDLSGGETLPYTQSSGV